MNPRRVDRVVFFSNPFCYGPTGKAASLVHAFEGASVPLVYAGSEWGCDVIGTRCSAVRLKALDLASVREFLASSGNPGVVSCMDSVSVRAARDLGLPSVLVDSLAWFWSSIPSDFLLAETYFALDFPGVREAVSAHPRIRVVPNIGSPGRRAVGDGERGKSLLHLGGLQNPLDPGVPTEFLDLLVLALAEGWRERGALLICAGPGSAEYLRRALRAHPSPSSVEVATLAHDAFLRALARADHMFTTPGITATMEALERGVPVSFLPPMNLSQWRNLRVFEKHGVATNRCAWEPAGGLSELESMDEHASAGVFPGIARSVAADARATALLISRLGELFSRHPDGGAQAAFVARYGADGAEVIASRTRELWRV